MTTVLCTEGMLKVSEAEFGKERGRGTRAVGDGVAEGFLRSGNNRNHDYSTRHAPLCHFLHPKWEYRR